MTGRRRQRLILVIDDDDNLRQVVSVALANAGYAVLPARGNDEALVIFERESRSLSAVISDSRRPLGHCLAEYGRPSKVHGLAGVIFFERYIRKMNPNLPVVFFSAERKTPANLKKRKLDGPLVLVVFKPARIEMLIEALEDGIKAAETRKGRDQR
jgi:CheY-like chemotaxis protein